MVVICAGTTGFNCTFDVRYMWMHQKRLQGSHFAHLKQASAANKLMVERRLDPCMSEVFPWADIPAAHMKMLRNQHKPGNMAVLVQAPAPACAPSRIRWKPAARADPAPAQPTQGRHPPGLAAFWWAATAGFETECCQSAVFLHPRLWFTMLQLSGCCPWDRHMRHDWVFDVLDDLRAYALSNGLPRTAAKVVEALAVARDEIAPSPASTRDPQ
jgi:hypothetical protein